MDMNWLWTYFETMKMCNDNLRQAVAFMDEFPDYTMIQSQAAVYKFVERVDPPLFKRIQEDVKAGRLELGAACGPKATPTFRRVKPLPDHSY